VKAAASAVENTPSTRSPAAVVVIVPLDIAVPVASVIRGVPSSELDAATPAYSKIAKRSVPPLNVSATVTVLAPPAIASA
jgi:hypothetical protein